MGTTQGVGAARLKELKDSVRVLVDPATEQYIALADENRPPKLAPLHLATLAPDTAEGLDYLQRLACRRGIACDAIRIDAA
jgi:hypothetical protein